MQRVEKRWMHHALSIAGRGLGQTWPNPTVGCVIVKDSRVVGRGVTSAGGRPHAEVVALEQARIHAKDADVYVTLEPCAHHGQTGPCAMALINAGVRRVVIAHSDPDPRVSGAGRALLRKANIVVVENFCEQESYALNAGFFKRVQKGLPWVTLKLATTLDGRIAMAEGESRWITHSAARRMTHLLRSQNDAILVGRNTIVTDDPDLRVRNLGDVTSPVRVVLDTNLSISNDAKLFRTAKESPVWIAHDEATPVNDETKSALEGVSFLPVQTKNGQINVEAALRRLGDKGITRVLCEGGGLLAASLLNSALVDEIVLFQAGKLIGRSGLSAIGDLAFSSLADAPQFSLKDLHRVGPDTVSFWRKS